MAGRLRGAEWLAALGAVVLLVALFGLHWYGQAHLAGWWSYPPLHRRMMHLPGLHLAFTGWQALPALRWLLLATALAGLALAAAQAAPRGPALAVTIDMLAMLLAGVTTILVAIRLASTAQSLRFGAFVGLAAAAAVTVGAYRAFRTEAGRDPYDPAHPIEVVALGPDSSPADGPA